MTANAIRFYRVEDHYGCFSNFSAHPIALDGHTWPTSEHYFQAQKFREPELQARVRAAATPGTAARIGRSRQLPLRKDWESIKDDVMRRAVRAKLQQHADVRATLLETGDATLIEHTRNDSYWGDGGDGSGKNMLGKILMELRAELLMEQQTELRA